MSSADLIPGGSPAPGPGSPVCPACGQHVDRANLRCPRCRRWLTEPPAPPRWKGFAGVVAAFALVLGSFIGGMILQWLFAPLPWGVVVVDAPDVNEEARETAP